LSLLALEHSKTAYRADFALYGLAIVAMAASLLVDAPRGQRIGLAATSVGGWAAWSLIEYVFHRFLLHGMSPFREWHAEHHARPTARIASPTVFSAFLILVLVVLPAWAVAGAWPACALTLGVTSGYFAYAVTHHATHHWRARSDWLRRRKLWHATHHHDLEHPRCFGVTTAFWDRVFGTP
jgi:sterol desaturase/sphingolipid hydroxylase (fatty acid hydroxylase superfamily)